MLLSRFAALALLLAVGCGGGGPTPTGDPIVVIPAEYRTTMELVVLSAGDTVSLEFPPQGGHVLFIGARAQNLDEEVVTLRARLRAMQDNSIVGEEARNVSFYPAPDDPTVKEPDLRSYSNVSNVPVCPSYTNLDLFDQPFTLEVTITEPHSMRTTTATTTVVPTCKQTDPTMLQACKCG